ncbi:probable EFB1-translation elongation factor eEF1beta [Sporisorium reilianum SRZ2]|uniref:Elongation factor 1-beta n=1 Tax=Sporisorium reilianum (strain SRZ2) TaxID=999809 RepID=E6ZTP0_SPORE|nr:probable EFB1-translation elongation factor eEF1beta [Sporisorium reilianum SRZ2]
MSLPDFSQAANLTKLDGFLADKSYVDGHSPSQADVAVYEAIGKAPESDKYSHVSRWYEHITSYEAEHKDLTGDKAKAATLLSSTFAAAAPAAAAADDDDDVDLFGSDDEVDEEAERIKAERVAEYNKKKAAKGPGPAAKSLVTLDIKPWDDETDMKELEASVRAIEMDGLVWGSSKLVAIGYGVSKLQCSLVVEDAKVSLDELQERIADECEDYVQSTDVAAMAKI